MRNSIILIKEIYQFVWMYNNCHDKYEDWHTPLMDDTAEIAPIVKNYCKTIIAAKSETSKIVKDAVENIYKYCRPENYKDSSMNTRYPEYSDHLAKHTKSYAHSILDCINELIDANKSENDMSLQELNNKWKHKWLYFNGDESGQQIIRINKIHYVSYVSNDKQQLAFDGSIIELFNENSEYGGIGVRVDGVENYEVERLYYIKYISEPYDYEANDDDEYSGEWSNPKKLDAAFSSKPIDTDMTSRIISDDEVKEMINSQFFGEYGAIEEKCYDK